MSWLQFQATYGKPILAARDAKCSAKEAESGALAMEALHKQVFSNLRRKQELHDFTNHHFNSFSTFDLKVMPFLLRRTKDEVLSDLPPKIVQDRYCDLSPLQLNLYEKFSHSQAKAEVSNVVQEYGVSGDSEGSSSRTSSHVFQVKHDMLHLNHQSIYNSAISVHAPNLSRFRLSSTYGSFAAIPYSFWMKCSKIK